MNITLFGTGYVGLVTGACFAEMGNSVVCVDVDLEKIAMLERGVIPIYEPGLQNMVRSNHEAGRLTFTADATRGVIHGEILFVAVGTPPGEDGSADLSHVLAVATTIATNMNGSKIIVGKSTVPVGTGDLVRDRIASILEDRRETFTFDILSNPEFLKEGAAVADFMKPDRVIIGSDSRDSAVRLEELYAPFNRNHDKVLHMDIRSAELTKYASNVMLASRISLMNELANIAEHLGADIEEVRRGIGSDPRIGPNFIYAGCGYGGSCFPKDVQALIHMADENEYSAEITRSIAAVNHRQKEVLFEKLKRYFKGKLRGRTIALWGLAFKPNTDDMREAPSRTIVEHVLDAGGIIRAYDPQAMDEAKRLYGDRPDFVLCSSRDDTLTDADALVVVTEWNEFRSPNLNVLKQKLRAPAIFDGRNLFDPTTMKAFGFDYYSIGRTTK